MRRVQLQQLQILIILLAVFSGMHAKAFDGGGFQDAQTPSTIDFDSLESLPDYSRFHAHCLQQERSMWGDVAELMEDLAISHCTCMYIGLETKGRFDISSRESVSADCYRQGMRNNKARFIQWALPLHQQRLQQQQ